MSALTPGAAVFLDRDGTLIREVGYLSRPEQVEILPSVGAALRALRDYGFKLVVVTNQSAVARGRLSESALASIHLLLREKLAAEGAFLDAIYYCPHHPSEGQGDYRIVCNCRKPRTGMVDQAVADLGLSRLVSYVVGDQATDMELAAQVGATGILLHDGPAQATVGEPPVVADLWQAAQWIIAKESRLAEKSERQ
jgi:D-glycero-D-manno-heptose 1,7-bisphosphate phosphatase